MSTIRVALLGRQCADNANLGIDYLMAALQGAGLAARAYVLNDWREMDKTCDLIIGDRVELVGLSLPDGGSAFLPLGMGEMLRARG